MATIEERLTAIEARLRHLESQEQVQAPVTAAKVQPVKSSSADNQASQAVHKGPPLATQLLGWGGATALVLAASYIIKLALSSGWLTPHKQIAIAVLGALLMIGLGIKLRQHDRSYASLLPAGGVTILFIALYGAHLYYGLIEQAQALAVITLVCFLSLWLCHLFQSTLYAFFAVAGAYSVPFLMRSLMLDITALAMYYTCWSLLFSIFAVWVRSRAVYLLALYMAMIGFDLSWHMDVDAQQWISAALFQTVLLLIFASTAAYYTIKHHAPIAQDVALAHLPALLIFYFLQYSLLERNIPDAAPWVAVASAAFIGLCYGVASLYSKQELAGGRMLLQAYIALVLFHAGYLESVSHAWAPWVAFILLPLITFYAVARHHPSAPGFFIWLAVLMIFVLNYLRIVSGIDRQSVISPNWLSVMYALELYAGYYWSRKSEAIKSIWPLLLVGGHLAAAAAAVHIFENRVMVSFAWGLLALACLLLALNFKDKLLGKSSLLIFAISAGKVLIYDLSSSAPLIRIGTLLVVGSSLYLGGWLYKKIDALT